jgi:hypothetical protein
VGLRFASTQRCLHDHAAGNHCPDRAPPLASSTPNSCRCALAGACTARHATLQTSSSS